jgi:hypothetical protein
MFDQIGQIMAQIAYQIYLYLWIIQQFFGRMFS